MYLDIVVLLEILYNFTTIENSLLKTMTMIMLTIILQSNGLELGGMLVDIIIATLTVAMVMIHLGKVLTGGAGKELHILCHLLR